MKAGLVLLGLGLIQNILVCPCVMAERPSETSQPCKEWDQRVDPDLGTKGPWLERVPSDDEVIVAIDCLLRNRGDRRAARFGGATDPKVSQVLPGATVELASLYYISYLFTGNQQHGEGVALWNRRGIVNPPGSVDAAYRAYTAWFKRVRSMGLSAARSRNLDPLKGTGLRWYGSR